MSTPRAHKFELVVPNSTISRRFRQVYVEIPPSPLHTPRISSLSTQRNQPLSPTKSNMPQDATTKKRKLSDPQQPTSKKQKVEVASKPHKENALVSADAATSNQTTPNMYCHQCGRKRDYSDVVLCTSVKLVKATERRCTTKYCIHCIRNRYSQDSESTQAAEQRKFRMPQDYKCPKCRDICNCSTCRKAKGLQPLGKQPQPNSTNADQTSKAKKASPIEPVVKDRADHSATQPQKVTQPKPPKKAVVRPLPKVNWQRLPVQIPCRDVEVRMGIREFVLRFEDTVGKNMGKANLEELENIVDGYEKDIPPIEEDSSAAMVIKKTMKEIRSAGINLTKTWSSLAALRETLCAPEDDDHKSTKSDGSESSEDRIIIDFPDPLPPPEVTSEYNTRSTRGTPASVTIINSYQLIPVIEALIQMVIESSTLREQLEEGVKQGKEITRDVREAVKRENEKWEGLKQLHESLSPEIAVTKVKEDRECHKQTVQGLETAHKVAAFSSTIRFGPLGSDHDGRIYWTLSPGVRDREFANSLIANALNTSKNKRGRKPIRRAKTIEERTTYKAWSYFVAVWGKKPVDGSEGARDNDEEGWWVFWEPEEIRKLANWVSARNGLDVKPEEGNDGVVGGPGDRNQQLKSLVKNLQEYATVLEWRCKGEEEML